MTTDKRGRGPWFGAVGLAVVAVAGLTACGSGSSGGSTSTSQAASSSANPGHGPRDGVMGKIASESPTSWTLTGPDGSTETVTIDAATQFGDQNAAAQASDFTVGELVHVEGQVSGTTVTATRISKAHMPPGGPGNGTPPSGPPPSGAPPAGVPPTGAPAAN